MGACLPGMLIQACVYVYVFAHVCERAQAPPLSLRHTYTRMHTHTHTHVHTHAHTSAHTTRSLVECLQLEARIPEFGPAGLAMLAYACGQLGGRTARVMARLLASATPQLARFSGPELSALITSCARLGQVRSVVGGSRRWRGERLPWVDGDV